MRALLNNWKTTSSGLVLIAASIIRIVFQVKAGAATEDSWIAAFTGFFGGIGLIFAGDASASKQNLPQVSVVENNNTKTT